MNGKELGTLIGSFILPGFGSYVGYCIGNAEDDKKLAAAQMAAREAAARAAAEAAKPVDYSEAREHASDNNLTIVTGQVLSQEIAFHQAALDRELQAAASTELAIEKLDTKLQIDKMNYLEAMSQEEHRHQEKMARQFQKTVANPQIESFPSPDASDRDLEKWPA